MALNRTMTYYGEEAGDRDLPRTWYHYLVIASPGTTPDSGVASIITLSQSRAEGMTSGPSHIIVAKEGGPAAALASAEAFLDRHHPGLKKIASGQDH
jgi:hypothetical protein